MTPFRDISQRDWRPILRDLAQVLFVGASWVVIAAGIFILGGE